MDIIAEMQHRNRVLVHNVKGVQSKLGGMALLIERDGDQSRYLRDTDVLVRQLRHLERELDQIAEAMQS